MPRLWQQMPRFQGHHGRYSMPSEKAELLPCVRIEDRQHSPKERCLGGKVLRSPPCGQINFPLKQLWLDGGDNRDRDVVLQGENIRQVTLEPVRPNVRTRHCINQLPCDPDFTRRLAHGPLKNIAHAKSVSDLPYVDGF